MKISKLFHWLYACVMLLPLVVAPVYAIFMHRHNVTNYEVQTGGYEVTEKYTTNEVNDFGDLVVGNIYHIDYFYITDSSLDMDSVFTINILKALNVYLGSNGTLVEYDINYYDSSVDNCIVFGFEFINSSEYFLLDTYFSNTHGYAEVFSDYVEELEIVDIDFYIPDSNSLASFVHFCTYVDFGGTISSSDFQVYDYQYNEGLTYNDTDIGSQFVYSIYLPLNKYFNVTSFLGLNNLYSWINTNVFSGTAPLGFNIFYMLLSYWLLVSIFWLVFDVVMYVPNLAHRWLDKGSLQ